MHPLLSLLAASAVASLDLMLLAYTTARLGTSVDGAGGAAFGLLVVLKLGLLALGVGWLARQPWNDRRAMILGLLAPFALFVVWQAVRLQLRVRRQARIPKDA